jgi:hypothetical protein
LYSGPISGPWLQHLKQLAGGATSFAGDEVQWRQGNQGASLKSGSRFSKKALRPS